MDEKPLAPMSSLVMASAPSVDDTTTLQSCHPSASNGPCSSDGSRHMHTASHTAAGNEAESSANHSTPSDAPSSAPFTQASTAVSYVIPGCTAGRYYRVPDGLKRLRAKRKVALIFGYIGERYCGLQWNHLSAYPTVEEALLKALFETSMISEQNFSNEKVQQLLNFERASRTDKGVHALCNVISVNVMLPYDPLHVAKKQQQEAQEANHSADGETKNTAPSGSASTPSTTECGKKSGTATARDEEEECASGAGDAVYSCAEAKRLLNAALPDDIHVYDVVPATRSFNAYMNCGSRKYEYYLPTFALMSAEEYRDVYFPASLAPSRPTLEETGFVPRQRPAPGTTETDVANPSVPVGIKKEERSATKAEGEGGEEAVESSSSKPLAEKSSSHAAGSRRKSRGHFPKRKPGRPRRRLEGGEDKANDDHHHHSNVTNHVSGDGEAQSASQSSSDGEEEEEENAESPVAASEQASEAQKTAGVQNKKTAASPADGTSSGSSGFRDSLFETMVMFRSIPEDVMQAVARYRVGETQLRHARELFAQYEGTHCFHNFTPGGSSKDASCYRFIRRVTVSEPFVVSPDDPLVTRSLAAWSPSRFFAPDARVTEDYANALAEIRAAREAAKAAHTDTAPSPVNNELNQPLGEKETANESDAESEEVGALRQNMLAHMRRVYGGGGGVEVVRIELDGQSFMLNQIRKMIGAVVCILASGLPHTTLREVLLSKREKRGVPMVPANGLFLAHLDFSGYNRRLQRIQNNGDNATGKGGVDMTAVPASEWTEQRDRTVAVVMRNEMVDDLMGKWMRTMRHVVRLVWSVELP